MYSAERCCRPAGARVQLIFLSHYLNLSPSRQCATEAAFSAHRWSADSAETVRLREQQGCFNAVSDNKKKNFELRMSQLYKRFINC